MAVRATSHLAYDTLRPELPRRQALVLKGLFDFQRARGFWPTSYELFMFLRAQTDRGLMDLNSVRPRLTELSQAKQIEEGPKRHCAVTQRAAFTWVPVVAPRLF